MYSTPKTGKRGTRTNHESYSAMHYSTSSRTPSSTPTKRLSYLPFELASTTPKPTKAPKQSARLAIMRTPQEIRLTGKDVQKSVKAKCLSVDTDRLKNRQLRIAGPRESLVLECPPEVSSAEKIGGDFLFRKKLEPQAMIAKKVDISFELE